MYLVLDTNVWVNAFSEHGNKQFMKNCFLLISDFMQLKDYMLSVDIGGVVLSEYSGELRDNRFFQLFMSQLRNENRIYYVEGKLDKTVSLKLLELGFHEDTDQTFTAVAINAGKYIISDDSDYGTHEDDGEEKHKVHEYMCNKLGLRVDNSNGGLLELQKVLANADKERI